MHNRSTHSGIPLRLSCSLSLTCGRRARLAEPLLPRFFPQHRSPWKPKPQPSYETPLIWQAQRLVMEAQGRIQCVLIATTGSNIVYERFYERFTDIEKADIRQCFQQTQSQLTQSSTECIGRCRTAATVAYLQGDLVYHAAGTGEYDELALAEILRFLVSGLHDVLRRAPGEAVLLDNYTRVCIVISEIINEGILEIADRATLLKALKIKASMYSEDVYVLLRDLSDIPMPWRSAKPEHETEQL